MLDSVKDYYGKVLNNSSDLQTDACCDLNEPPDYLKTILAGIHDEVMARYYGCGLIAPAALEGLTVLDLGCGSGRDVFALSALVGEQGHVIGVDMTDEQLSIAERHRDYHAKQFGYSKANTTFHKGYIEQLDALGLEDNSIDLIVSNCVINLSPDKQAVLAQAYRLLKPGGEMYFSDVYADRRIDASLRDDPLLYGECLSGALYWNDFIQLAKSNGFTDPRLVEDRPLNIDNASIREKLAPASFYSATYRLFKLPTLEAACEDYGQAVVYRGGIPHHEAQVILDKHHVIEKGKVFPVCGNTWLMLHDTRFKPYFEFIGNTDKHYGIFAGCGTPIPFDNNADNNLACC